MKYKTKQNFVHKSGEDFFFHHEEVKYSIIFNQNRFNQNRLPFLYLRNEKTVKLYMLIPTCIFEEENKRSKLCIIECTSSKEENTGQPNPQNNFESYVLIHCFLERKMYMDALKIALPVHPTIGKATDDEIEILKQILRCEHRDPESCFFRSYAASILDTNDRWNNKNTQNDYSSYYTSMESIHSLIPAYFTTFAKSLSINYNEHLLAKLFLYCTGGIPTLSEEMVVGKSCLAAKVDPSFEQFINTLESEIIRMSYCVDSNPVEEKLRAVFKNPALLNDNDWFNEVEIEKLRMELVIDENIFNYNYLLRCFKYISLEYTLSSVIEINKQCPTSFFKRRL